MSKSATFAASTFTAAGVACLSACDNEDHHNGYTGTDAMAECTVHHQVGIAAGLCGQVVAVMVHLFRACDEVNAEIVMTPLDNIDGDGGVYSRLDAELGADGARELAQLLTAAADFAATSTRTLQFA